MVCRTRCARATEASPTIIIQEHQQKRRLSEPGLHPRSLPAISTGKSSLLGPAASWPNTSTQAGGMDVLIIDQDLAAELYEAGLLAPLLP